MSNKMFRLLTHMVLVTVVITNWWTFENFTRGLELINYMYCWLWLRIWLTFIAGLQSPLLSRRRIVFRYRLIRRIGFGLTFTVWTTFTTITQRSRLRFNLVSYLFLLFLVRAGTYMRRRILCVCFDSFDWHTFLLFLLLRFFVLLIWWIIWMS